MPPKSAGGASKKNVEKKKEKVIDDKTFGLKNKKGTKQQKFIEQVQKQVKGPVDPRSEANSKKTKKELEMEKIEELNKLFKPVMTAQKLDDNVDPKSVLCVFHKQGLCTKAKKCKFSHDLNIERKAQKINIYSDNRDQEEQPEWTEESLQEAIEKRHGNANRRIQTEIICKFFLEAVEDNKYGFFWDCPNGNNKCMYRHALPPGFVLNKDKARLREQEKENQISIEELIETERAALGAGLTRVTATSFAAWKKRRKADKIAALSASNKKKADEFTAGRTIGLSGRDLFEFNPDFLDDDEAAEDLVRERDPDEEVDQDAAPVREINLEDLAMAAHNASEGATIADPERLGRFKAEAPHATTNGDARVPSASLSGTAVASSVEPAKPKKKKKKKAAAMDDDFDLDTIDVNEDLFGNDAELADAMEFLEISEQIPQKELEKIAADLKAQKK